MERDLHALFLQTSQWHNQVVHGEFLSRQLPTEVFLQRLFESHQAYERSLNSASQLETTLQTGIGGVPDAVLSYLTDRRDLGVHTELVSDGVIPLIDAGIINGARKTLLPRKVVLGFVLGSKKLFDYVNENPIFEFRPNFFTNTPDILQEVLQKGGPPAFKMRLALAATLSPAYGIYSGFELCENVAVPGTEEYLDSEKYEIKRWDLDDPKSLKDVITRINRIRQENRALQTTWNLEFYETDNDNLLCYGKSGEDGENNLIIVVNLDPFHTQSGWVTIPVKELGLGEHQPYLVHDLIGDDKYIWEGERNFVEINPQVMPGNIFRVRKKLKRETDFDYFM